MQSAHSAPLSPFWRKMLLLSRGIDKLNRFFGMIAIFAIFLATFISAGNALIRHFFNWSSNGLLEAQWYLFAAVFLFGSGYTYLDDRHIRIDILTEKLSRKSRAKLEIFGILFFLIPAFSVLLYMSIPTLKALWVEHSSVPGGLHRAPLAILIPTGIILLLLQGVSQLIKSILTLKDALPEVDAPNLEQRKEVI